MTAALRRRVEDLEAVIRVVDFVDLSGLTNDEFLEVVENVVKEMEASGEPAMSAQLLDFERYFEEERRRRGNAC